MKPSLRQLVRERAGRRCEYCHLPDFAASASNFHLEHVFAKQHGGTDDLENRCWCCQRCNLHKGPNLSGIDPLTGGVEVLFHPRGDRWADHSLFRGVYIYGLTASGRATVVVLALNDARRIELRQELQGLGELI